MLDTTVVRLCPRPGGETKASPLAAGEWIWDHVPLHVSNPDEERCRA